MYRCGRQDYIRLSRKCNSETLEYSVPNKLYVHEFSEV